jgi:glycosyltransferase involved in cell wall biosynthesis
MHNITIKPILYGGIIARFLGVRHVIHSVTGVGFIFSSPSLKARLLRVVVQPIIRFGALRSKVRVLFENQDDLELFVNCQLVYRASCHVVPSSGVDIWECSRKKNTCNAEMSVVLMSRMLWDKGIWEFVQAAAIVRKTNPGVRFLLVGGTDPNPAAIKEVQLREWVASGAVEWLGWRRDVNTILLQADIVCLPSYREGLPRSLLEGAIARLPLVATNVPGCREVVQHELTGYLVPVRDAVALADAISRLVRDPELRDSMGRAAREDIENRFSVEKVMKQTLEVYSACISAA